MAALFVCQGKDGDVNLNLDLIKAEFGDVEKMNRLFKVLDKVGVREDEMAAIYQLKHGQTQTGYTTMLGEIFNEVEKDPSLRANGFVKDLSRFIYDQLVKSNLEISVDLMDRYNK